MSEKKDLNVRQIALFFIAFLPVTKIFIMPKDASNIANEDMWLSVLIALTFDFFTIFILTLVNKKHNKTIYQILEDKFGVIIKDIILILLILVLLFKAFTPIYEQKNFVQNTMYETSLASFIFAPFFIISTYLSTRKFRAIGRLADLCWFFTIVGFLLLISLSIENSDFLSILPIGANGLNIFKANYFIAPWFCDAIYFIFFLGRYNNSKNSTKTILLGFIISSFFTIIFSIVFYAVFTFTSGRELFALAEISKYSTVINSIGRFDYIGIFSILISNTISICLPLFFIVDILREIFKKDLTVIFSLIVSGIYLILFLFFEPYHATIITLTHTIISPVIFLFFNVLPLTLIFIKPKKAGYKINLPLTLGDKNAIYKG